MPRSSLVVTTSNLGCPFWVWQGQESILLKVLRSWWSGVVIFYSQCPALHLGYLKRSPHPPGKLPGVSHIGDHLNSCHQAGVSMYQACHFIQCSCSTGEGSGSLDINGDGGSKLLSIPALVQEASSSATVPA